MRYLVPSLFTLTLLLASTEHLLAHPAPLAQARINIDTKQALIEILFDCDATAFVMNTTPGHLGDELAAQLTTLSDDDLHIEVERAQERFESQFEAYIDGRAVESRVFVFPPLADLRAVNESPLGGVETEQSTITIRFMLTANGQSLVLRFPRDFGGMLLTAKRDGKDLSPQLLAAGQQCAPVSLIDGAVVSAEPVPPKAEGEADAAPADSIPQEVIITGQFVALGFWHIIPTGPDHILFVLGLFLLSPTLKPLLWQVTAFTLAHSVTLALAMFDVVRLPSTIVEPLIAASIAFIAIENIFTTKLQPWRPIVVFSFGLLHGLGFAGVLSDLDMPVGQFVPALIGFNLGVEAGQLAVIAIAFLLVGWFRDRKAYRFAVTIPVSLLIAAVGVYWAVQRVMGA